MRLQSTDAGDVIGIDLGTTNSCVAIMVRVVLTILLIDSVLCISLLKFGREYYICFTENNLTNKLQSLRIDRKVEMRVSLKTQREPVLLPLLSLLLTTRLVL